MATRLISAPRIDFASLRRELKLPTQFSLAAQREADEAVQWLSELVAGRRPTSTHVDRTDIAIVTLDPAESRDLDQAMCLHRLASGYRVYYAIADVTSFVAVGGQLEAETWGRGQTIYLPDGTVPLHPVGLSEGAASLLPDQTRPAVLWTIDLDRDAATTSVRLERAIVRSRAKLDYASVQAAAVAGTLADPIALLPQIGALLVARGLARGAISLPTAEQEVADDGTGWRLVLRSSMAAEEWNAQISLLTGASAAAIMLAGGVGLLRTMPAPRPEAIAKLRVAAVGLSIDWPDGVSVGQFIATLDPGQARDAAFLDHTAELLRGAGYTAFDGTAPADPGHGAVATTYAHVTAPLRRLADRYATEVCLSLAGGVEVPDWVRSALPRLPDVMATSDRRAGAAARGAIDLAEAVLLADRVGEEFDAVVIDVDDPRRSSRGTVDALARPRSGKGGVRPPGGVVVLDEPPVRARCAGDLPLGERIRVRLVAADPGRRTVAFEAVQSRGDFDSGAETAVRNSPL